MFRPFALLAILLAPFAYAFEEAPVAPITFGDAAITASTRPAMASDGENYFAVWSDDREGVTAVYGARITADREVLDPIGVRLLRGHGAAVAYGDERYLVVDSMLQYAIVDREARVRRPGQIAEQIVGQPDATPVIVAHGPEFIVFHGIDRIDATVIDRDGNIVVPSLEVVAPQDETRVRAAASNGSRIVILYTHGSRLYAAVMTVTGTIVARDLFIDNSDWSDPFASVIEVGGGFVAAFARSVPQGVAVVRFDADGNRVGTPASIAANAVHPQIVNESGGLRLFSIEGSLETRRVVSRALTSELVAGEPVTVLKTPASIFTAMGSYAAAAGLRGSLAVGEIYFQAEPEIDRWLYAVDGDAPSDTTLVTRAGVAQHAPAIASGDGGTLVTWEEPGTHVLRGKQGGVAFDFASYGRHSSVAAQDDKNLVVWRSSGPTALLLRGGAPIGAAFTLDLDGSVPVVASDDRDFIVAWIAPAANELRLARVDTTGAIVDRGVVPIQSLNGAVTPALACDRGECLVAWGNEVAHAVRIDALLAVIDQDSIALGDTSSPIAIAAAANDGRYAIAWQHEETIEFRTIDRDGVVGAAFTAAGRAPALAAQGDAWVLLREAGEELIVTRFNDRFAGEFSLTRDAQARRAPALAVSGANVIVAYERTTRGEEAGGSPRIYVTTLEPPKPKRRAISR